MCVLIVFPSLLSPGITSDPLTQFSVVFAAMIHDVDHSGLPNAILVRDKTDLAEYYNNKSVAEQNSVDLTWALLMDNSYKDLCACIFTNEDELYRFRQVRNACFRVKRVIHGTTDACSFALIRILAFGQYCACYRHCR